MAKSYCTNPDHRDGDHDQSCMPSADPNNPELRLLRAIFGMCSDCDHPDPSHHETDDDYVIHCCSECTEECQHSEYARNQRQDRR